MFPFVSNFLVSLQFQQSPRFPEWDQIGSIIRAAVMVFPQLLSAFVLQNIKD
jgi:hypothetical protein